MKLALIALGLTALFAQGAAHLPAMPDNWLDARDATLIIVSCTAVFGAVSGFSYLKHRDKKDTVERQANQDVIKEVVERTSRAMEKAAQINADQQQKNLDRFDRMTAEHREHCERSHGQRRGAMPFTPNPDMGS